MYNSMAAVRGRWFVDGTAFDQTHLEEHPGHQARDREAKKGQQRLAQVVGGPADVGASVHNLFVVYHSILYNSIYVYIANSI